MTRAEQRKTENRHSERAIDVPGVKVQVSSVNIDTGNSEDKTELANVQVHRSMSPTSGINLQQSSIEIPTFQDSCLSETSDNLRNVLVDKQNNSKTKFGVKVFPDLPFSKERKPNQDQDLESGVLNKNISVSGSSVPKLAHENEAESQNKENSKIELNFGIHSNTSQEASVEEQEKNNKDDTTRHIDISPINCDVDLDKVEQPSISLTVDSKEDNKFDMKCSSDKMFATESSSASNESVKKNFNDQLIFLKDKNAIECESKNTNQIVPDSSLNISLRSKQNVELSNLDIKPSDTYLKKDSALNSKSDDEDSNSSEDKNSGKGINISSIKLPSFGFKRSKETDSESDSDESTKLRKVEVKTVKSELKTESKSSEEKLVNQSFKLDTHEINPLLSNLKGSSESQKESGRNENNFQGEPYRRVGYEENNRQIEESSLFKDKPDGHFENDEKAKKYSSNSDSESDRKYQQDVKVAVPDITMHSLSHKLNTENVKETFLKDSKKELKPDLYIPSFNLEAKLRNDPDLYSDDIESGIKVIESSKSDDEAIKRKPKSLTNPSTSEFEDDIELKSGSVEDLNASWRKSLFENANNRESYCFMESEVKTKEHSSVDVSLPEKILPSVRCKVGADVTDSDEYLSSQLQKDIEFRKMERKADEEEESEDEMQVKLKHGVKIGKSDINLPSLSLKSESKGEKSAEEYAEMTEKSKDNSDSEIDFSLHANVKGKSLSLDETGTNDADKRDENEHKPLRRLFSDFETDKTKNEKKKGKEKSGFNFKFKGPEFSFPNFGNKQEKQSKEKLFKKSESLESTSNSEINSDLQLENQLNKTTHIEIDLQSFQTPSTGAKGITNKDFDKEINSKSFETKVNVPESHDIQSSIAEPKIQDAAFTIPALNLKQYNKELDFSLPALNLSKNTVSHKDETDKINSPISLVSKRTSLLYGDTVVEVEGKTNAIKDNYSKDFNDPDLTGKIPTDFKVTTQHITIPTLSSISSETKEKEGKNYPRSDLKDCSLEDGLSKDESNLCIQLPRVKISNSRSGDAINKGLSDNENLSSSAIKFPKVTLHQSTGSETDDWKIKNENGYTAINNVSLLREKFNSKLKEQEEAKETKNIFDADAKSSDTKVNRFNVDSDEPDFLIPNLKLHSEYNSASFSPENFSIPNLKVRGSDGTGSDIAGKSLDYELNWKQKQMDILKVESNLKANLPSSSNTTDVNVSLDSSSIENESDLPEADSDYKKVSNAFMLDVPIPKLSMTKMNLEKNFNKNSEISYSKPDILIHDKEKNDFGNPFGFRGFKKHIDSEEKSSLKTDRDENNSVGILNFKTPDENNSLRKVDVKYNTESFDELKDELKNLPEADYDFDYKNKSIPETNKNIDLKISSIHLPEGEQDINNSIERKLKSLEKSYNIKSSDKNDLEEGYKITKTFESNYDSYKQGKGRKDDEEEKTKSKIKLGLGFGFKAFGSKSSDSEDTEVENKVSKEPDGNVNENTEKYRGKTKKTFSFKGFGKSSSDTEEEYSERVSETPMKRVEIEDKENLKTNANMGMKLKAHKNSDSDDNAEPGKTSLSHLSESNIKKTKVKSNLSFGFINKSKAPLDVENAYLIDSTNDNKKEQYSPENEDAKSKSKTKINLGMRGSKELKYDTRSESEGGDEDKINLDSKGDEMKGKSKYGIGFGFRKSYGKTSSDSEGGDADEQRVHLDERGNIEKGKESKSKSIKLGFKGFKNLKGKIQTEINKMRHDSPSSDEGENEENFSEKRKKITKKKDKEKKMKRDSEKYLDATEEATLSSAAHAAKDNRKKKHERKSASSSSSSSSSSSESSSEDEGKSLEQKKKKKSKLKRKDEAKSASNNTNKGSFTNSKIPSEDENNYPKSYLEAETENKTDSLQKSHVTVVMSEPSVNKQESIGFSKQNMEIQSDPRNYVVVREMKLKENTSHFNSGTNIQPFIMQRNANVVPDIENEGFWGSDSDMDKGRQVDGEINSSSTSVAIDSSGKQRVLTDSEELKRRAASLGDLSRLHEGTSTGTLLERAVSLDLKSASVGPPNLHVRRLQLPDSSATSIEENDESTVLQSPKKAEIGGFLKSASQWGTLEEAMILGGDGKYKQIKLETKLPSPNLTETPVIKTTNAEGVQISNIEISGEKGSSITALSAEETKWDDSFEEDDIPSLPSSPIPVEKTTITVMKDKSDLNEYSGSDSNIVVVGSEPLQAINNIHNFNFHLHPSKITSSESQILSHHGMEGSVNASINSDSGRYSPRPLSHGENDAGGVTITMVSAESHINTHNISSDNNLSHLTKTSKFSPSKPSDLIQYESVQHPSLVTVSHDLLQENGEIVIETTEHNVSDEFITHDLTPQKTTTQITLDGEGVSGFTVTEGGTFSRTVIISNPELDSPVNIVQAQERRELSS